MLGEESKDDSDSHTIFNEQNKCKASTEMVRIILSNCLHDGKMIATVCFPRNGYLKNKSLCGMLLSLETNSNILNLIQTCLPFDK
jgi:hypothetical protein